jgi:cell division protein FtsA
LVDVVRNPIHATGVGLLLFGAQSSPYRNRESTAALGAKDIWTRMKQWFQGNF